jgi:hypothetical protein
MKLVTTRANIMNTSDKNNRTCQKCGTAFYARQRATDACFGKFCSRTCAGAARKGVPVKDNIPNTECAYCRISFYKKASRRSSSSLYFCCREHKDLGQKLQNDIKGIWPNHYGMMWEGGSLVPRDNQNIRMHYRTTALESGI